MAPVSGPIRRTMVWTVAMWVVLFAIGELVLAMAVGSFLRGRGELA